MSVLAAVLVGVGVAVVVLASVAAVVRRDVLGRLHYLTPVTSVGGPLIGAGLAVANGPGLTTATVLLVVVLLAITGPVLGAAIGQLVHGEEGGTS